MADRFELAVPVAKRARLEDPLPELAGFAPLVECSTEIPVSETTGVADINDDTKNARGAGYPTIARRNARLEHFYRTMNTVPPEEWDAFMETLRESLPSSFRITGFRSEADAMKNIFYEKYLSKCSGKLEAWAKPLKFYPRELAYQLDMSKRELRRCDPLVEFRQFLVAEDGCGNVSRQETVSMIPPILLEVRPGHKVLDMCAAPGSKTGQIIEMLHTDFFKDMKSGKNGSTEGQSSVAEDSTTISTQSDKERVEDLINTDGLVIANDADYKRCHLLNHQMKRLHTPCLIISNHDAAQFPNIRMPAASTGGAASVLAFDRILCDVPCSGDGTIRKNLDMWKRWSPTFALGLHYRQFLILKRGLELLAVGGRLVYSTCSMNPIENEAVIARALKLCGGEECVKLIDCRANIECGGEGLRTMPGLTTWPVIDDAGDVYYKFADLPSHLQHGKVQADMFPPVAAPHNKPTNGSGVAADSDTFHLDRCIRILPHHNNTGVFFVAVMEKLRPLPWQRSSTSSSAGAAVPVRLKAPRGFREEPYTLWTVEEPTDWEQVKQFYRVADSFPVHTQCFVRAGSHKTRNVFLVTERVQQILSENRDRLQVCATGVRILSRSGTNLEDKVRYRLVQEGIHVWLPLLGVNVVRVTAEDARLLLTDDNPLFGHFSDETQQQVKPMPEGSVVVVHEGKFGLTMRLIAWRATCSLKCFVALKDREHFLRLLNETSSM